MPNVPGTNIPKPKVELSGTDGNAYFVMGKIRKALVRAKVPKEVVDEYIEISKSGDYGKVIATASEYADIC